MYFHVLNDLLSKFHQFSIPSCLCNKSNTKRHQIAFGILPFPCRYSHGAEIQEIHEMCEAAHELVSCDWVFFDLCDCEMRHSRWDDQDVHNVLELLVCLAFVAG